MDFGAVVTELMKCLGAMTWEQARYSLCFNSLVEELDQEKNKLEANIEDMNENVREYQENTRKVGKRLELELEESKNVIKEVDELVKKVKPKKTCCHGPCPDLIWQYRLGRQVANKMEAMKQINAQFPPRKLSRIQSLPDMEYYTSEDFISFNSTKKASDELLKALKDPNIRRIGLYGMGGCGKTTLVKEVGKEAQKHFKKVVFVAVSSNLVVRKIQGSIADALKLTLKEENEPERAKRLYMRLSVSEKILIILDDVWEELNFEAIGIPFDDKHRGCRILLTTRLRGVCVSLKCDKMVLLDLLSEKESWQLFKKHAGINEDASEKSLKGLPQVINKACKGLAIAVAAIASALKDKTLEEWKEACDLLKHYEQVDIANNSKDPYASLRLSYDHLKRKEAQDLFLLCSLFPEDSEIMEEDLIRMGVGLGLFENVYTCDSARIRGGATIRKLLDSFLLLQAKEGMSVMLHDILRAVGLRIAGKQIQTILEPTVPPSLVELPDCVATEEITKLYCHNIHEFPFHFKCPNLDILIMCKDGKGSRVVPDEFFNEMGKLKVLTIINKSSWQNSSLIFPMAIWWLKCLRTLCIRGCRLDFIFSFQQLQHLEILEFRNCFILQLPNDIAELRKLKLLEISRCRVRGNPYKVLGSCPKLEELYFLDIDLDEEELKDQNLAEFFGKNGYLTKLKRYNLQIGAHVDKLKDDMKSRFLSICPYFDQDSSISTRAIKDLAQRAEVLFLENILKSCENVIPDIVCQEGGCMNDLVELLLRDSNGIRCLVETTNKLNQIGTIFSNLHKLRITGMNCMEGFCHGKPPCGLFEQLKELECSQLPIFASLGKPKLCNLVLLKLESCPKLESLFTPAVAVSLVLLEELKITKCHGLMFIIGDDNEDDIMDDDNQKTYVSVFKKLKELVVGDCSKLEYLIPLSFAWGLENLEVLKIYLAPNLKYAFGKYNHTCQSHYQHQNEINIINLPVLKVLELLNLEELISICPENYKAKFPGVLDSHIVDNCPNLDTIISTNAPKVGLEAEAEAEAEVQVQQDGKTRRKVKLFFMLLGISTIAENLKEWVYAPIQRQARYSLSFNRYVKDLRTEKETLKFIRQNLEDRVQKENLDIDSDVKEWSVNANTLIEEAEKLEQQAIAKQSCCLGCFPNLIQRHDIGKQAARKINSMIIHNQSCEFQNFSHCASLPHMEDYFQEDFIFFDSRKSIYYSLLESLKEDQISILGLYGPEGSGKTALAKQVAKEAEQLFDWVVFVVVSSNADVQNVQEEIARSLDWELEEEHGLERADQLFMRLASGERILLILDDVWERLDFRDIGIPFGVNHKGCSVLITTQRIQVCIMMDCQRMFPLELLTDEEAWTLFQTHAHISDYANYSLKDEAKEVMRTCGGLPMTIAAMASTLKGKTEIEWKEVMGLFLFCSMFPRDFKIHEEYLIRYGILLSLFREGISYKRARNRVTAAKERLTDSGLLLKVDGGCVKMNDLFRDLALSIANKEVIVALEGIHELRFRSAKTLRYLWCEEADKFPNEFDFPKLEFLYLSVLGNSILPDEIFKGMKYLRVLLLCCKSYNQDKPHLTLAKSILSLPNLVGLFLEGWELGDISFILTLNRLEALVLWSCSFQELPTEIAGLRGLRLLDLSECVIKRNPYEAIARCSQLQELYFKGNSCSEYQGDNGVAFFQENDITLQLERYHIEIGGPFGAFCKSDFSSSRSLSIENFYAFTSRVAVKNLVERAEVLSLGKISGGYKSIIPGMVQEIGEGMNELIELWLWNSQDIKCIVDSTSFVGAFFPHLIRLGIQNFGFLKTLCEGPIPAGSFEKLKSLELYQCTYLSYLFTGDVAQSLEKLEVMIIDNCYFLSDLIWDADADANANQKSISAFPKLEQLIVQKCAHLKYLGGNWILNLGNLRKLVVKSCPRLKSLFVQSTAKTMMSLEELIIEYCYSLKEVFGVSYGEDSQAFTLPRLKILRFIELPNLIEVSRQFKLQHVINALVQRCPNIRGSVGGFQNLSQGQNPGKEGRELESESAEKKREDLIGQSRARSQERSEVHNALAGSSNMINETSSSGYFDAVNESSTYISKGDRDAIRTSLNQYVVSIATTNQEYQTPVSSSIEATAVLRHSSNITKEVIDATPQSSLTQDANLNEDDQRQSCTKETVSIFNVATHLSENFENGDGHLVSKIKGTANEEPTLQTIKEPVQVQATLKIDQNVHGINIKGEDLQRQEFDTSSNAENTIEETSKESVHEQVPISENYSLATSLLDGKDSDSQTATNLDANLSSPHTKTNPEYQTPEERGNQKKVEDMDVIEQSTTQTGIPIPEVYDHISKNIKFDKLPKTEMITGVEGQLQNKGVYTSINLIDTTNKPQEHEIPPIDSLHLIEIIGETTMGRSTVEVSSLDLVIKLSNNERVSMDHQEAAFRENKVSPGNMPTEYDLNKATGTSMNFPELQEDSYQGTSKEGKHDYHLDNVNTGTGSSGIVTLELPASVPVAQAPIQTPVSSVSLAPIHALPTEVDPMISSSAGKPLMTPEEDYAPFRDIIAIKKKHIHLLEQAIARYPSLWTWHEKYRHPQMKQFGYIMLGNMLEFLVSTKWRDLTEEKKDEFLSLLDGLEAFGFDNQWLVNTCARIKGRKTVNRMTMLEQQAMALESELQKTKLELDGIRVELEDFSNFIGF